MQHLFTPWRLPYVTGQHDDKQFCELCRVAKVPQSEDETNYIVHRGNLHYIVLNIYPYTTGHVMVVPYAHKARLSELTQEELHELTDLAAGVELLLQNTFKPHGINIGLNLGSCAGAGIADHLHMHIVPRWSGDTGFMTVTGDTRVVPEELRSTWQRLHGKL